MELRFTYRKILVIFSVLTVSFISLIYILDKNDTSAVTVWQMRSADRVINNTYAVNEEGNRRSTGPTRLSSSVKAKIHITKKKQIIDSCSLPTSPKKILWYDFHHNGHGLRNKAKTVDLKLCSCPCDLDFFHLNDSDFFMKNKSSFVESTGPFDADAILIQLIRVNYLGQPPVRLPNQVLVTVEREAAPSFKIDSHRFHNVFNWTMTYRHDSDIFYPYGRIVKKKIYSAKDYSQIYKDKKKGVIWFVSHCKTRSEREKYVEELRKHIPVDIYGRCSPKNLTCPKRGPESKKCMPKLIKKYMFCLAFENTYHRDYVTEKVFNWFAENIVLVVLGSANYSEILPKGTYIDVNDFQTPHELADFLKDLMSHKEKYLGYLQRKENYTSLTLQDSSQRAYCQLCLMLHQPEYYQKTYADISKWWVS